VDANGNPITGSESSVKLSIFSGPAGGKLSGATTATAKNGVATFSGLSANVVGTYVLKVTSGSLSPIETFPFIVLPGNPAKLVFAQQPNSVTSGTDEAAIAVEVEDSSGQILTTDDATPVTLGIESGPNGAVLDLTVDDVNGIATFSNVLLSDAGSYKLEASSSNLTPATSKSFTVKA